MIIKTSERKPKFSIDQSVYYFFKGSIQCSVVKGIIKTSQGCYIEDSGESVYQEEVRYLLQHEMASGSLGGYTEEIFSDYDAKKMIQTGFLECELFASVDELVCKVNKDGNDLLDSKERV